jgi:outer membrane protein assembly factor BamB
LALGVVALLLSACEQPIVVAWKSDLGAPSVSTPLVTKDFIAAGTERGVVLVDLSGNRKCMFDTHSQVISAPQTDGKRLFFGSVNYMFYAIDLECQLVWKFATGDRIKSDPLLSDGRVYTSSYDGHVYALDAATGDTIWTFPQPPSVPVVDDEGGEPAKMSPRKRRRGRRGRRRRTKKAVEATEEADAGDSADVAPKPKVLTSDDVGDFSYSSPTRVGNALLLGNLDHHLYAINVENGQLLWRFRTDAPVTSSPKYHKGIVYFGSNDGNLYALQLETQEVVWKLTTQEWINSSAHIVDKTLYIGANDRNVYAVDLKSGRPYWKFATKGPIISIPTMYKNLVLAAGSSGDGQVYAIDSSTLTLFWAFPTGGKIDSDPVLMDNRMYVTSTDQFLYAFDILRTHIE